jgi:hypothetical protein
VFVVKIVTGAVMLAVVSTATYLVAVVATSLSGGNYSIGALAAVAFFLVGLIFVVSWMNRHAKQWWNR